MISGDTSCKTPCSRWMTCASYLVSASACTNWPGQMTYVCGCCSFPLPSSQAWKVMCIQDWDHLLASKKLDLGDADDGMHLFTVSQGATDISLLISSQPSYFRTPLLALLSLACSPQSPLSLPYSLAFTLLLTLLLTLSLPAGISWFQRYIFLYKHAVEQQKKKENEGYTPLQAAALLGNHLFIRRLIKVRGCANAHAHTLTLTCFCIVHTFRNGWLPEEWRVYLHIWTQQRQEAGHHCIWQVRKKREESE